MTARDFCYWLQGFFELNGEKAGDQLPLTARQADLIRRHLALVFARDIDPQADGGDPKAKKKLDNIHGGDPDKDVVYRC